LVALKKVIAIPDSFKGTMSSAEICGLMRAQVLKHYPNCEVREIPVADGGEGSVECFLRAVGGKSVAVPVKGPFFEEMEAAYGILGNGETAVVEMAAAAGLPLAGDRKDPMLTTTFGVGLQLLDAAKSGAKKIILGLGGSATNDGGCGAACALGVRFYNEKGESFVPVGGSLRQIQRIDMSGLSPLLKGVEVTAMCDIDNPMHGPNGAAHVFGPQKGATPEAVEALDAGLVHLAEAIGRDLGIKVAEVPGSGAAGAMGAGMLAFCGARLQMGIEAVLDTVRFDSALQGADLVLTGEGKIDSQSLRGKVVVGVARRAKKAAVPVVAVVGDIGDDIGAAYDEGVSYIASINRVAVDFSLAKPRAQSDLSLTVDNLMRFCKAVGM
jgi:glycerate kinase